MSTTLTRCGLAIIAVSLSSRIAAAGPSFNLDEKVLRAQAIAEVDIIVFPKKLGWPTSRDSAKKGKVLRTVYSDEGLPRPSETFLRFPFSGLSRCWGRMPVEQRIRTLVFVPRETVAGLEEDGGAYTSLNADYPQLVEAVLTVSKWRSQPREDDVDEAKLKIVTTTSNPYLRYVGARFLKERTRTAIPAVEKILTNPPANVAYPEAECAQRKRRGPRSLPGHSATDNPMDEPRMRTEALERDKEARTRRSMRRALSAVQTYEAYLARFGDQPPSYEVHSQFAELLYDLGRWQEANREYRRVVELLPRGDRSEHGAYQRVITANNIFDCGAFEDRTTSPIPLPACAQEQLAAYEMYLQYFGEAAAAVKFRYRRALLLQDYKRYREAADALAGIVTTNDREELAPYAAVRLLEVLTESGRRDEACRWAHKLKGMPRFVGHLEVQAAVAEVLGETKPSKPPQPVPLRPPDVVPGAPSRPIFLPDDSGSISPVSR